MPTTCLVHEFARRMLYEHVRSAVAARHAHRGHVLDAALFILMHFYTIAELPVLLLDSSIYMLTCSCTACRPACVLLAMSNRCGGVAPASLFRMPTLRKLCTMRLQHQSSEAGAADTGAAAYAADPVAAASCCKRLPISTTSVGYGDAATSARACCRGESTCDTRHFFGNWSKRIRAEPMTVGRSSRDIPTDLAPHDGHIIPCEASIEPHHSRPRHIHKRADVSGTAWH